MTSEGASVAPPAAFPLGGRRLIIYALWDRRGGVDDYIRLALSGLRAHAERILVVVNGELTDEGRRALASVSDEVLVRENVGLDLGAHQAALLHVGDALADFDEIVLTNDSWFGPVHPFEPVLERMSAHAVHFWGMTDHGPEAPDPYTKKGGSRYHLQWSWIAVRRDMFLSSEWGEYWRQLSLPEASPDAVRELQAAFTEHFTGRGRTSGVAFGYRDYHTKNPALFDAETLIEHGCPVLKRRPFFQWPPFLDHHSVIGRWTLEKVAESGFPMEVIWQHLARNAPPKDVNTDAGMLEVLPDIDVSYDAGKPFRVVVIAHIFYEEMTSEMLDRADTLPGRYDLIVTTPDEEKGASIRSVISARGQQRGDVEVRVLPSNDGRDQSAFLIACRDVLLSDRYDLVVKIHSKKTVQDGFNVGRHFKSQQFDNLLNSPGYAANVLALFQKEPGLGMVYPTTIHIGYPTMGRGWWSNKPGFETMAAELGIRVPLDDISPLAPYGSMYVARPEALRVLVEHEWTYDQFGGAEAYRDGGLAHILERMPSYAAGELGYHTRTISSFEYMSISHTTFEFNFDELSATIPGHTFEQIEFLHRAGYVGHGRARDFARIYLRLKHPEAGVRIQRAIEPGGSIGRWWRRLRRPRTTLRNLLARATRR